MQQPVVPPLDLKELLQVDLVVQSVLKQLDKTSKRRLCLVCQGTCSAVRAESTYLSIDCDDWLQLAGKSSRLQQQFPKCTGLRVQLRTLAALTGKLPDLLLAASAYQSQLTSLSIVGPADDIPGTSISSALLMTSCMLPSLQSLSIYHRSYPLGACELLGRFQQLTHLFLGSTTSSGIMYGQLAALAPLTRLQHLECGFLCLEDGQPGGAFPVLPALPQLTSLHMSCADNDLQALTTCASLKHLSIMWTSEAQLLASVTVLGPLTGLTSLTLKLCSGRPEGDSPDYNRLWSTLSSFIHLNVLCLPRVDMKLLKVLTPCSMLTHLAGSWGAGQAEVQLPLPVLHSVQVWKGSVTSEVTAPFASLPSLRKVSCSAMTASSIAALVKNCKEVHSLELKSFCSSGAPNGSWAGAAVRSLCGLPKLQELTLVVSDSATFVAAASLRGLTELKLHCDYMASAADMALLAGLLKLSVLQLTSSMRFWRTGIFSLSVSEARGLVFGLQRLKVLKVIFVDHATRQHLEEAGELLHTQFGRELALELSELH